MQRSFKNIKGILIDLSGTLHIENNAIPGAHEALEKLKQSEIKFKFVTNTTKEDLTSLHQRLKHLQFTIDKDDIYTSLTSARKLVEKRSLRPHLMLSDKAKIDFSGVDTSNCNAVVVGLSPSHFNYDDMNVALNHLLNGSQLIAINKARYINYY